ncbi:MAG: molybdenum cofactor biosynthesis protein MoaE [Thermosphaera sp.]
MVFVSVKILDKEEPLALDSIMSELAKADPDHYVGGVGLFIGLVKGDVNGSTVFSLEYSAIKDMAERVMSQIAYEIAEKYGLQGILIYHRVGELKPGELTLVIAVAGKSRVNVMPALAEALERVKKEVPVFKLEHRCDGDYWIVGDSTRIPREKG